MKETENILVVDDNQENLSVLERFIVHLGHEVDLCSDGDEALELIKEKTFDVIFCDINMPRMNGLKLLQTLRNWRNQTPMVMITGFPTITLAVESMKKGATDFVTKPFQLEHIEHIMTRIQKEKSLVRENRSLTEALCDRKRIEELNQELQNKIQELSTMYSISEATHYTDNTEDLFDRIVGLASTITQAQEISIMLFDSETDQLVVKRAHGNRKPIAPITVGQGVVGKVALDKRSLLIPSDRIREHSIPHSTAGTFLSLPMKIKDEVFGILNISKPSLFTDQELHLLQNMLSKFTLNLENHALYESIYENLVDTLRSLIMAVEAKDLYTKDHSQRVTDLSILIANEMTCSKTELETLRFGGFIHDIGKIGVQDTVLLKPGRLTDAEVEIIRTHPVIGENIVRPLRFFNEEQLIVRHHHERYDGRGYPDRLQGEEIPFLARILAVADTYDAITSTRPYRTAKGHDFAVEEIKRCKGTQFDPNVADAFLSCLTSYGREDVTEKIPWKRINMQVQNIV